MAKFCSKCGMKLNEETGKCPNCDEKTKKHISSSDGDNSTNVNPKDDESIKETGGEQKGSKEGRKKTKKIVVIIIVIITLLICIGAGIS